jgi:hypothetical protein
MQTALYIQSDPDIHQQTSLFDAEVGYSAAKFPEEIWKSLMKDDLEGYRLHLAFDSANVQGFKTGYLAIKKNQVVVCLAPFFITDYHLDTTVQGKLKSLLQKVREKIPFLMRVKILCVGSPITDACKMTMHPEYPYDPDILQVLNEQLQKIASKSGASVIAFKDVLAKDLQKYGAKLNQLGYSTVKNMPVAVNRIDFATLEDYYSGLSYATRKDLRRKIKKSAHIEIKEYQGMPPNIEEIHALYLETYDRSDLKFEKLTSTFFEFTAGLMPQNTRFVLYYSDKRLIAFNMLLHNEHTLMDKYIGMHQPLAADNNIYFLSWIYNIEMCLRDGLTRFQSGQASYEVKKKLGASLEDTYILFKHTNRLLNQPLAYLAKLLAYENFDANL